MGKTNVYAKRRLLVATLNIEASVVFYGFQTAVEEAETSALGLTVPTTGVFVVIGANKPKPTRMMKKETGYTVSSFASTASISSALTAGWKVQKVGNRYRHQAGNVLTAESKKSVSAYVPMTVGGQNIKYAWRIPSFQVAKIGQTEATELGIVVPTTDTDARDMLFGVNNVKPPRASKTIGTTGDAASFTLTMFYDADATLSTWTPVAPAMIKGAQPEF